MSQSSFSYILLAAALLTAPALTLGQGKGKPAAKTTQLDRAKKPSPGPAPVINIGNAEQFTLENGLKVFVVTNRKLPVVTYSLVLDYDPILEGAQAGYVAAAGELISAGTKTRTKDQLDDEIDFMGASLSTSASGVYASGLSRYSEKIMELMADVVLRPSMPEEELDKIKKRTISGLLAAKTNPDAISRRVAARLLYGDKHPYGESATEETVSKITRESCAMFYSTYYRPNITYLALVGDITPAQARDLVSKYLAGWMRQEVPRTSFPIPTHTGGPVIALVDRPASVQSVISVAQLEDVKPADPGLFAIRLMNDVLGGGSSARLFNNLRERHGWTYGAYSQFSPDKVLGRFSAGASVRTAVTDSSVAELLAEIRRMGTQAVADSELVLTRNGLSGSFIQSLEQPQTVANFAINIARYGLPADYYKNYLKSVAAINKSDIQATADKLLQTDQMVVTVVGNAAEITPKLSRLGKVQYYDDQGRPTEPNTLKMAPAGVTAQTVLARYVEAVGGAATLAKMKDYTLTYTATIMDKPATMTEYAKAPNKAARSFVVDGNQMMSSSTDGKQVMRRNARTGSTTLEGPEQQAALAKAVLNWETDPAKAGITAKLIGQEKIEGREVYKLELTLPGGSAMQDYFDASTGLRVRRIEQVQGPQGPSTRQVDFGDYKSIGPGYKVPGSFSQPMGPQTMTFSLTKNLVNTGLKDDVFGGK